MKALQHATLVAMCAIMLLPVLGSSTAARPKIFMYELPEKFHNWTKFGNELKAPGCFYSLDYILPALLRNTSYHTTDANEADFFFVDAWMYWPWQDMNEVVAELKKQGPWWDRKQGADHIFVVTADPGRCQFPHPVSRKAIYIHHFGMLQKLSNEPCNLFEQWGASCDPEMHAALGHNDQNLQWGCHIPHQDIVVPPSPYEDTYPTPYLDSELASVNKTIKLYYSGKIDLHEDDDEALPWSDAHYSFGARQTLFRMFHGVEGFQLRHKHSHGSYWKDLSSSIFCVAAAGWAWGGRMKVAVTRGCIPVIVQDGIKVEWEEQLPLEDYAIRIPMWMAHKTPDILDSFIKSGKVAKMQKVLDCAWRLHWWRRPHGRAFELVMCELKRRALGAAGGKIQVDWDRCEIKCGDDEAVSLRELGR